MWYWPAVFLLLILNGFLIRSEYEKRHFSVEKFTVTAEKITEPKTFIFLSDLHNHEFGSGNRDLLDAIDQIHPDGILVGGDMMVCNGQRETGAAADLICHLAEHYPVWCGNGNHENRMAREQEIYGEEYKRYTETLRKKGVVYLSNDTAFLGADIAITGIDLEERFYRKLKTDAMKKEEIEEKVGMADHDRFQILLIHSPLFFDTCQDWGADLTLSGHMHGGTIRLPWLGGIMTPQYQFFLPWCAGEFCMNKKHMIVSRGLGTHSINIRINNKPQVVVIELNCDS